MNKQSSETASVPLRKTIINTLALSTLITQKKLDGKTNLEIQNLIDELGQSIDKKLKKHVVKTQEVYAFLNAQKAMKKWEHVLKFLQSPTVDPVPVFVTDAVYEKTDFCSDLMTLAYETFQQLQWEKAQSLYSFIASFYPFYIKPYLFLAAIEEKINGVASAFAVYETLLQSFKDPELYFSAADCFWRNGRRQEVVPLLTQAREHLQSLKAPSQEEQNLLAHTLSLLNTLT